MFIRVFFSNSQSRGILTNRTGRRNSVLTNACVAQLVEQRIRNAQVIGSSPITSSKISAVVYDGDFSLSGGDNMADRDYLASMKNAEASVRMEGCKVIPQMRKQCEQVLNGKTTTAEYLKRFAVAKVQRESR